MTSSNESAIETRISALQRASDFQAALLGMAGHDLRQPLQVIQSTHDWLASRVGSKSDQARLERSNRAIGRLTEQLDRLVSALRLYEYTKAMELSSVELSPLFLQLCKENDDAARQNGINLRACSTATSVTSHPLLLSCILGNLISNAVRYTEPGGRILIGCRQVDSTVRIDVYDTGIGIAPERQPKIFKAFERLDSRRCDGLGIGLFVVLRAIELLGHRIEVSSTVSRGSRFSVFAPRASKEL